jgi:response regulator RpfG family c-di-GMP phosphodiesterase
MPEPSTKREQRVIVADDEPIVRELVRDVLRARGYHVQEAGSGQEVLHHLAAERFDLLISDIWMPGMSGLELLGAAREVSPGTSSILITGAASLASAREAARRGAYDYLPKPFTEKDLIRAAEAALNRRHNERAKAREAELEELFRLSEEVRTAGDAWEMLRVTTSTAMLQTESDVACLVTPRDGRLLPFTVGPVPVEGDRHAVSDDDLLAEVARSARPLVLTSADPHPLEGRSVEVRRSGLCYLGPVGEALIVPTAGSEDRGEAMPGALAVGRKATDRPYDRGDLQIAAVLAAQCGLLARNSELVEDLERAYVGTVNAMALMVEARDRYTRGHSRRVAEMCVRLAWAMDVPPGAIETLRTAADLHDIGKLAVPDNILNKPGKLTSDERQAIQLHPSVGAEVIAPADFLAAIRPLVLHHHERVDGWGYPGHLGCAEMTLLNHIIIAADAWDAMTSDRPYRPALSPAEALSEVERGLGSQFEPAVGKALVEIGQHDLA